MLTLNVPLLERKLLRRLGLSDKVEQRFVAAADFPQVYAQAAAFIYPSLYEVFGLPILDAFADECPTLLANASCFPEIAADAALYFDPADAADLREKLRIALDDPHARANLTARSRARLPAFTWPQSAHRHARVYAHALNLAQSAWPETGKQGQQNASEEGL